MRMMGNLRRIGALMAVVAALGLLSGAAFAVSTDGSDEAGVAPTEGIVGSPELVSASPNVLSVPAGGGFFAWTYPATTASAVFGDLDVAWLWDDGWVSFAPILGVTDFDLEFGAVLWLGTSEAVEIEAPMASRLTQTVVFQLATPAGEPQPSREPNEEELARGVPADAVCFDVPLTDVATGEVVGTGTDCLFEITALEEGGVMLSAQTTFNLPEGSFTAAGRTSVQAITTGEASGAGGELTHITGAIPIPGTNNIIAGTGVYEGLEASVRLSGSANLGGAEGVEGFPATMGFDCIFVVTPL
jgi:hypothetical protein